MHEGEQDGPRCSGGSEEVEPVTVTRRGSTGDPGHRTQGERLADRNGAQEWAPRRRRPPYSIRGDGHD